MCSARVRQRLALQEIPREQDGLQRSLHAVALRVVEFERVAGMRKLFDAHVRFHFVQDSMPPEIISQLAAQPASRALGESPRTRGGGPTCSS